MPEYTSKKYTYFITGGGTGGHVYPAVAAADALLQDETTAEIYYIGNPKNLEFEIAKQKGYKFLGVSVHGMPREFGLKFIKWAFQMFIACIKCCFYLLKYKPDAVFATGGYVSAPILLACRSCINRKVPYMLHDCDAQPGLVTRKFASHADSVSLAFESAAQFINNKNIHINGNPIRKQFQTLTKEEARESLHLKNKLTLCVMGGSQGAKTINEAAVELLKTFSQEYDIQVIFQTGRKNFERVIEHLIKIYPEYSKDKNIIVKPYFEDMVTILKASDIAISRSGSLSLSEICASGLAAILVPYPHAAANHQRKNAQYMVEKNAAVVLEDSELTKQSLQSALLSLLENSEKRGSLQRNAFALAKFDSTEKITTQLRQIAGD